MYWTCERLLLVLQYYVLIMLMVCVSAAVVCIKHVKRVKVIVALVKPLHVQSVSPHHSLSALGTG